MYDAVWFSPAEYRLGITQLHRKSESPVLFFYLNFVCVATLVPRLLFSVSGYIGNFLMKAEVTEFV